MTSSVKKREKKRKKKKKIFKTGSKRHAPEKDRQTDRPSDRKGEKGCLGLGPRATPHPSPTPLGRLKVKPCGHGAEAQGSGPGAQVSGSRPFFEAEPRLGGSAAAAGVWGVRPAAGEVGLKGWRRQRRRRGLLHNNYPEPAQTLTFPPCLPPPTRPRKTPTLLYSPMSLPSSKKKILKTNVQTYLPSVSLLLLLLLLFVQMQRDTAVFGVFLYRRRKLSRNASGLTKINK